MVEFVVGSSTELSTVLGGSHSKLDIISASTDDKSALSGHTRQVQFWGIDRYNNLRVGTVSTSGTTVSSATNSYKEINDFAGFLYGSSDFDAKGNIDIGQVGKVTNEVFRIAADTNTINNTRIWLPKKWRLRIASGFVSAGDAATGRSTGILVFPHYYDDLHQDEDSSHEDAAFFHENEVFDEKVFNHTYGNDDTMFKVSFKGLQINNGDTWNIHARYLIWGTHAISGSQNNSIAGLG